MYGSRKLQKPHRKLRLFEILRGLEISKTKVFKGKYEFKVNSNFQKGWTGGRGKLLFISSGKENGINGLVTF